ncbi:MAG: hypothetical protein ACOX4W_05535 [Bacilli bacterium]
MTFTDFLNEIEIKAEEIEKAKYYCELKGVGLHFSIFNYLSSMKSGKVKYSEIASAYRYDKRIRKVLYKYMGLFEEYLRAYIANKYSDQLELVNWIKPITKKLEKENNLTSCLDDILFSELIDQVISLKEEDKSNLFSCVHFESLNLKAILELRNAISHNRFLLNYLKFKDCIINNERRSSLHANLLNFSLHLRPEIRRQFIKELDECSYFDENKKSANIKNQTTWELIEDIIIKISIDDTVYNLDESKMIKTTSKKK